MFKKRFLLFFCIGFLFSSTQFWLAPILAADETVIRMSVDEAKVLAIKDFTKVATSDPEVIEVVITSGQEIMLNAKKNRDVLIKRLEKPRTINLQNYRPRRLFNDCD